MAIAMPLPPTQSASGTLLQGKYVHPWRSPKGKLKGLVLQTPQGTVVVKLPKYLRPMLVRELMPETWWQVWAQPEDDHWEAVNLLPLAAAAIPDLAAALAAAPSPAANGIGTEAAVRPAAPPTLRLQICQKGKCCKQGSRDLTRWLQAEVAHSPAFRHVVVEPTGCLKACKHGPNVCVKPGSRMVHHADRAAILALLTQSQP